MWWRIFIPQWSFFDKPGLEPELLIETEAGWTPIPLPLRQGFLSLFFNPRGNLNHARGNLLERLLVEASGAMRPRELVSFALVEDFARAEARARGAELKRFKIRARGEDALVSA